MKKLRFGLIVAALVFAACDKIEVVALEPQSEQQALMTRTSISDDGHTYEVVTVGKTDLVLMDGTTYLLSDDIILSPGQVEFLRQEGLPQETISATRAAVSTKFVEYWPNGTIYYTIANNFLQPERVNNTIEHYHDNTGIRFVPRTNQRNYIEFVNVSGTTSWSYIGMIGEKQQIQISAGGTMGTVLHEVGHALGMYHEHERTDRNM